MGAYKCICAARRIVKAFTGSRAPADQDAAVVQQGEAAMVMTSRQMVATASLAVLIVASVMSMPRTLDVSRESRPMTRAAGLVVAQPAASRELGGDQVKDLTYN
jgi:hypothetical protein